MIEPLCGYLLLAESLYHDGHEFSGAWNFGPKYEDSQSVQWVVDSTLKLLNMEPGSWKTGVDDVHEESMQLALDIRKSMTKLNWAPRWRLVQALRKTIDWHEAWREDQNMRDLCIEQLMQYQRYEETRDEVC